jgi:hypothetical protein
VSGSDLGGGRARGRPAACAGVTRAVQRSERGDRSAVHRGWEAGERRARWAHPGVGHRGWRGRCGAERHRGGSSSSSPSWRLRRCSSDQRAGRVLPCVAASAQRPGSSILGSCAGQWQLGHDGAPVECGERWTDPGSEGACSRSARRELRACEQFLAPTRPESRLTQGSNPLPCFRGPERYTCDAGCAGRRRWRPGGARQRRRRRQAEGLGCGGWPMPRHRGRPRHTDPCHGHLWRRHPRDR